MILCAYLACSFIMAGFALSTWKERGLFNNLGPDIVLAFLVGLLWPVMLLVSIGWTIAKSANAK